MLVESKEQSSFGGSDSAQDMKMPYVVNDIATFFTLLVGIYFPSVTGEKTFTILGTDNNFEADLTISSSQQPLRYNGWFKPLR